MGKDEGGEHGVGRTPEARPQATWQTLGMPGAQFYLLQGQGCWRRAQAPDHSSKRGAPAGHGCLDENRVVAREGSP